MMVAWCHHLHATVKASLLNYEIIQLPFATKIGWMRIAFLSSHHSLSTFHRSFPSFPLTKAVRANQALPRRLSDDFVGLFAASTKDKKFFF
jgi:hypothetical protein